MAKYLLVDLNNMFHRCRHVIKASDPSEKGSMALHLILNSVRKAWRMFGTVHLVIALDGRSWRKEIYAPYKANRAEKDSAKTPEERAEDKVFYNALEALTDFVRDRTNVTVLKCDILEADDLVAGWIRQHPEAEHIIVSSDTDFRQLLAKNVQIYDGMKQETISLDGFFDDKGEPVMDKKSKEPVRPPDPEWILFEKCIRGDTSDNVFSAYPGVRTTVLQEAYEDRHRKGFSWNNVMNHEWEDHEKKTHRVKKDYERNRELIDLNAQPVEIKQLMDAIIEEAKQPHQRAQIGTHFLKFCGKWSLDMISKGSAEFTDMFAAGYRA